MLSLNSFISIFWGGNLSVADSEVVKSATSIVLGLICNNTLVVFVLRS